MWGVIRGADPNLDVTLSPLNVAVDKGGSAMEAMIGMNLLSLKGKWTRGHRLAIEAGLPLYQNFDGPQMKLDWFMTAGWQGTF